MKLKIEIELSDAYIAKIKANCPAYIDGKGDGVADDIAKILKNHAKTIEWHEISEFSSPVIDANGNRCGTSTFDLSPSEKFAIDDVVWWDDYECQGANDGNYIVNCVMEDSDIMELRFQEGVSFEVKKGDCKKAEPLYAVKMVGKFFAGREKNGDLWVDRYDAGYAYESHDNATEIAKVLGAVVVTIPFDIK